MPHDKTKTQNRNLKMREKKPIFFQMQTAIGCSATLSNRWLPSYARS